MEIILDLPFGFPINNIISLWRYSLMASVNIAIYSYAYRLGATRICMTVSTQNATTPKSTISRENTTSPKSTSRKSDFSVSRGTHSHGDVDLISICTEEFKFLDLVDVGVGSFSVEIVLCDVWSIMCGSYTTGWRRPIRCLNLKVIFRKRATHYRALLQKMTYEKASYESSPPCSITCGSDTWYS